jgi:hypothetical protein
MFSSEKSSMSNESFQDKAVKTALKDMFKSTGFFSICTIDKCCEILNVIPDKKEYDLLNVLHCIHWNKMEPDFREEVFLRTLNLFRNKGFELNKVDVIEMIPYVGKTVYKMLEEGNG